jgi:hypothetical protein
MTYKFNRPVSHSLQIFIRPAQGGVPDQWSSIHLFIRGGTGAKRLILLPLFVLQFSFAIFGPKIACQAPKLLNPNKTSHISVAF